jgi:hypothetical protein
MSNITSFKTQNPLLAKATGGADNSQSQGGSS